MKSHLFWGLLLLGVLLGNVAWAEIPKEWGTLTLVQEIDCVKQLPDAEFPEPGVSELQSCGGGTCRVLRPSDETPKYMAWEVGKGCDLEPGGAYVLTVEYPEDVSRSMFLHNGGNETINGLATGTTTGDVLMGRYVNHNPESLHFPLSGKMETWNGLFWLHDRFSEISRPRGNGERPRLPKDGFWVLISQSYGYLDPTSAGAAVGKIRLYRVNDEAKLEAKIPYPPDDLPRRYLFQRPEMADGVVLLGNAPKEREPQMRGVENPVDWYAYKIRWQRAMGMNVFCKDLLEFGHNQGWNAEKYGGNDWVYEPFYKNQWDEIVALCASQKMPILPYYEYYGSIGGKKALGPQKRAVRMSGEKKYTHIWWCERANVDLSDPDTLADFEKILDCTILKYKDGVKTADGRVVRPEFLGAWIRNRPTSNPVSFNDRNLKDFATQANGGKIPTRKELKADRELREKYYRWWFGKRRDYVEAVAAFLRKTVNPNAFVLYTTDTYEPGLPIPALLAGEGKKDAWKYKTAVVNDAPEFWEKQLAQERYEKRFTKQIPLSEVMEKHLYPKALQSWQLDWGGHEVGHSAPPPDPDAWRDSPDAMFTYTIHRFYSADEQMDAFRTGAGLACIRHFPLNEHELNIDRDGKPLEPTGYFIADVERAGAFCVLPEVCAVAKGDPTRLGYLTGNTFQRGFPDVVRAFNQAYLALPALSSELIQKEKYGHEWIRRIDAGRGRVWYAVCNLAFTSATVRIDDLPQGTLVHCVTGQRYRVSNGSVNIPCAPMSLQSFQLKK
ncbi:MAG: hypothetical protein Q4D98_02245 [Planctomycetia bacterium]|nr:hypothetical protein [Planctomycetia bacterium]